MPIIEHRDDRKHLLIRPATDESLKAWADILQNSGTDLAHKMALVAFEVETMKDPEDALAAYIASTTGKTQQTLLRHLEKWEAGYFESLVKEVAEMTGADPKQIADPKTRTEEQQKALLQASARKQLERMDMYFNSDYVQAADALDAIEGIFDETDKANTADEIGVKESFLLYYFSTRPDIRPSTTGKLTQTDKVAMVEQYKRFESFVVDYFKGIEQASAAQGSEWLKALEAFISAENPAEAQEIIENLTSVLPEKYVVPNNKLANTMTKGILDIGRITLDESRKGSKKPIETTCILTYEGDNVHLSGRRTYTEYDRNVYNAVVSLYIYGDPSHVVTPAMVYRAMTGLTDTEKPTPGQIEAVTSSMDKMRFIRAQIDCTEELKARKITLNSKQINGGEIDTNLLMAKWVTVYAGGQAVKALKIVDMPILYEYASAVKQVLTLPASMLDIKELNKDGSIGARLPNTESRILIKGYLLRRIEGMKGKNGLKNSIIALYDYEKDGEIHRGLYSIAGKPDAKDLEAKRIRTDIEKMLSYWQASGFITSFENQTQGRKITGYKITI